MRNYYNLRSRKVVRRSKSVHKNCSKLKLKLNRIHKKRMSIDSSIIVIESDESFNEALSDLDNLCNSDSDCNNLNIENIKNINLKIETVDIENKKENSSLNNSVNMAFDNKFAMRMIPSMSNKDDLHKFCKCVDVVWNSIKNEAGQNLCMNIIISKLEKTAYDVVRYKNFDDWPTLKTALEIKFIKRRSKGAVSSELINAVQLKDVLTFSNLIENLLGELNEICIASEGNEHADIIMKLNESTALNSFQNGLREPLRTIIKSHHFDSLSLAIAQAIEEEISHKPTVNLSNNSNKPKCSYCNKTNHTSEKCFKKPGNSKFNQQNKNKFFSKSNHKNNNSSQFSSNSNQISQSSENKNNSSSINQTSVVCAYCKEAGHFINVCYKKKYNELKYSLNASQNLNQIQNLASSSSENLEQPIQTPSTSVRVQDLSAQH